MRNQANVATNGGKSGEGRRAKKKNFRPASTQPRDTSPEPSSSGSSGEETALESHIHESDHEEDDSTTDQVEVDGSLPGKGKGVASGSEIAGEDEWVDVSDDDGEDLLGIEFHPEFIGQPEKRKRRFEARWDALVRAVRPLPLSILSVIY